MNFNSNYANIILAIGSLLPTASGLENNGRTPTEVTKAVDDASKNRDRDPEIKALSQEEETSETKTFSDL